MKRWHKKRQYKYLTKCEWQSFWFYCRPYRSRKHYYYHMADIRAVIFILTGDTCWCCIAVAFMNLRRGWMEQFLLFIGFINLACYSLNVFRQCDDILTLTVHLMFLLNWSASLFFDEQLSITPTHTFYIYIDVYS